MVPLLPLLPLSSSLFFSFLFLFSFFFYITTEDNGRGTGNGGPAQLQIFPGLEFCPNNNVFKFALKDPNWGNGDHKGPKPRINYYYTHASKGNIREAPEGDRNMYLDGPNGCGQIRVMFTTTVRPQPKGRNR